MLLSLSGWTVAALGEGGVDTGAPPAEAGRLLTAAVARKLPSGSWLRIRMPAVAPLAALKADRKALAAMRTRGWRICVLVRWDAAEWTGGVRGGGGQRLPVDLREPYARCAALAAAYRGLVDVWEVENEPDISHGEENAETYAAFLKACSLGLKGAPDAGVTGGGRVLMGALALPPGPYFERLLANGAAAYTDGLNYHYYGYAEDFSAVHHQFERAMGEAENSTGAGPEVVEKRFPVFVTEYGYGLLGAAAAKTPDGRARQARWFREVGAQLQQVRPEAALAFVLRPYREQGQEFGLLKEWTMGVAPALAEVAAAGVWTPGDGIRRRAGRASELVVDFVGGAGLEPQRAFGGYFVTGFDATVASTGTGEVVVYNFGGRAVTGELILDGMKVAKGGGTTVRLELAPGERRSVEVVVAEEVERGFSGRRVAVRFRADAGASGDAAVKWVSAFFPDPAGMTPVLVASFEWEAAPVRERMEALLKRRRAAEEPLLRQSGRWLVSEGVVVREKAGLWRFGVTRRPDEPSRPAMAELPLPAGFTLERGTLLTLAYRMAGDAGEAKGAGAAAGGEAETGMDVYVRTENGNLFHVWPRLRPVEEWRRYAESAENFSMAFFGRAELPWRFLENRPAALVFFFRPVRLPAVFEIKDAAVEKWAAEK